MSVEYLIIICTFIAGFLFIFGVNLVITDVRQSDQHERRLEMLNELRVQQRSMVRETAAQQQTALQELAAQAKKESAAEKKTLTEKTQDMLWQAGMRVQAEKLILGSGVAAVLAGGIVGALTLNVLFGVLAAAIVGAVPYVVVQAKRKQRLDALLAQLPDSFELMSRVMRAGQSITQSMQAVADEFPEPISVEFGYCYEQQNLGLNPEMALRDLANRTGLLEIKVFVLAMLIHRQTGGNLTELLDKLSKIVRDRYRLRGKVKALTAEGRMQGIVLMILPIAVYLLMLVMNRPYAVKLFDHPGLVVGALVWMGVGGLWIRKMVNFDF